MSQQFTIEKLPDEQYQFVLDAIMAGSTDRRICADFEQKFGRPLAKSSLGRWRQAAGEDLAQEYRLARVQVNHLVESLEQTDAEKIDVVMAEIEGRLLTAMRQIRNQDPLKLLKARQKETDLRLKQRWVEVKERELKLQEEQIHNLEELQRDRVWLAIEIWKQILLYLRKKDVEGCKLLVNNYEGLLAELQKYLEELPALKPEGWPSGVRIR